MPLTEPPFSSQRASCTFVRNTSLPSKIELNESVRRGKRCRVVYVVFVSTLIAEKAYRRVSLARASTFDCIAKDWSHVSSQHQLVQVSDVNRSSE